MAHRFVMSMQRKLSQTWGEKVPRLGRRCPMGAPSVSPEMVGVSGVAVALSFGHRAASEGFGRS